MVPPFVHRLSYQLSFFFTFFFPIQVLKVISLVLRAVFCVQSYRESFFSSSHCTSMSYK